MPVTYFHSLTEDGAMKVERFDTDAETITWYLCPRCRICQGEIHRNAGSDLFHCVNFPSCTRRLIPQAEALKSLMHHQQQLLKNPPRPADGANIDVFI